MYSQTVPTALERLVVWPALGTEGAGQRGRVHRNDPSVGEHADGGLVGVVDADDDVPDARELLGQRGQQQR